MHKLDSIRWRLVISYGLIALLTAGLVGLLSLTLLDEFNQNQTRAQLQANAQAIALQANALMDPYLRLGDLQDLARSMAILGQMRVQILDDRYNLMVDTGQPESSTTLLWIYPNTADTHGPPFLVPLLQRGKQNTQTDAWMQENFGNGPSVIVRVYENPWGRHLIFEKVSGEEIAATLQANETGAESSAVPGITARYPIGSAERPIGYVQLDSTRTTSSQVLDAMRRVLLLAGLGAALVAVIAGMLVSRDLTAPIQALAASATQMSSGDLSARAPEKGAGEIAQLARQFNRMAERLQASFTALSEERDALRRFISDASHELRTPVTALGNFIELLQGPAAEDAAARKEFLNESQAQVNRMAWITTNLLNLSRLDAGLVDLDRQPIDLGELLYASAAPFEHRAQQKGIRLKIDAPQTPIEVKWDRTRTEMALGNLLDNALKFTGSDGEIHMRGFALGEKTVIEVVDSGGGIDSQDLPHIFERFYRGQNSPQGSGLGLAIVHSIVQAHGGEVHAESLPGKGSQITITI
jgi:signal transduction histidine kinase